MQPRLRTFPLTKLLPVVTYSYINEKIASSIEKNGYVTVIHQDLYNDCKNITRYDKLTGG